LAADQGDNFAQLSYDVMLHQGDGIPVNRTLAAHYLKLSADQDTSEAQYRYGLCLIDGGGVEANQWLEAYYFKLAADQGHLQAGERSRRLENGE
jgi:TPR repeat protein